MDAEFTGVLINDREMTMEILGFSDITWISVIAFVLCVAFGLYMIITKKPGMVRSVNDNARYKDREMYAVKGGRLILIYSGVWLVMLIVSFFNEVIPIIIGIVGVCVFGYFWKKMNDEFGPV